MNFLKRSLAALVSCALVLSPAGASAGELARRAAPRRAGILVLPLSAAAPTRPISLAYPALFLPTAKPAAEAAPASAPAEHSPANAAAAARQDAETLAQTMASAAPKRRAARRSLISSLLVLAGLSGLAGCVTAELNDPKPQGRAQADISMVSSQAKDTPRLEGSAGGARVVSGSSARLPEERGSLDRALSERPLSVVGEAAEKPAGQNGSGFSDIGLSGLFNISGRSSSDEEGRGAPPPLLIEWGSSPRFVPNARYVEAGNHVLGWGIDQGLDEFDRQSTSKIVLRLSLGFPLSMAGVVYGTAINHEHGHLTAAWNAHLNTVHFEDDPTTFLGIIPTLDLKDSLRLTTADKLEFAAGGTTASATMANDLFLRMFERDKIDWTYLPLWGASHMDIILYSFFIFPRFAPQSQIQTVNLSSFTGPGLAGLTGNLQINNDPNYHTDMYSFAWDYAAANGISRAHARQQIMLGATISLLDPTFLFGGYSYFYRYLLKGEEQFDNPMPRVGDLQFWAGTGFWLARNGPQYRFSTLIRHAPSGTMLVVAPTWSDNSQLTVEGELRHIPIGDSIRGRVFGAVWDQRQQPEPGPKHMGYCIGGGMECGLFWPFGFAVEGGYKTTGALLGRDFGAGGFVQGGLELFPESRKSLVKLDRD